MNLKEEMSKASFRKINEMKSPVPIVLLSDAERIAEAYAKEKAWKYFVFETKEMFQNAFQVDLWDENKRREGFEKWWEENK